MNAIQPNLELVNALTLNDEWNKQRICENKEVDALLLAVDKWFCWNPYFETDPEDFDVAVTTKYSFSTSGIGLPTHSINPALIAFGKVQ